MGFTKHGVSEKFEVIATDKLARISSFLHRTGKAASELTEDEKLALQDELKNK